MATTSNSAVVSDHAQDVLRLRAAADMASHDIKDYNKLYEDLRAIVEALSTAEQAEPGNKALFDILLMRERRVEAARNRETATLALFFDCMIAEISAVPNIELHVKACDLPYN